jgi:hypothetical protein
MDWLDKLKEYAPSIASAVLSGGATLPQLAFKAISDATGQDVQNEDDLAAYVGSASPETMLKIKQANNAFKIRMRELDVELEESELKNQEHAREQHKHSIMPAAVTIGMTAIVAGLFSALFTKMIPEGNSEVFYLLTGQASALWGASITYWVGTTRSSANKDIKGKK